jgi:hypothetical protein
MNFFPGKNTDGSFEPPVMVTTIGFSGGAAER